MSAHGATNRSALKLTELLVVLAVIGVLAAIILPALSRVRSRSMRISCVCNLKQIGMGFRTWALDHHDLYPMEVSVTNRGSLEAIATGGIFRAFQVMSNELSTPTILVCPADVRVPAKDFGRRFSNANISYFIGLEATESGPQLFLSGDRNITNGSLLANSILVLTSNSLAGWSHQMHVMQGTIALADGSVQQFSSIRLREAVKFSGPATNRLAMP